MAGPIKVVVVDDSAFMRRLIVSALEQDPQIKVVGYARNGEGLVDKLLRLRPHVLTLDVEMPGKDGLSTLAEVMAANPLPVLMLSSQTTKGAEATLKALELGAMDFLAKPGPGGDLKATWADLLEKVKVLAQAGLPGKIEPAAPAVPQAGAESRGAIPAAAFPVRSAGVKGILAIGTSTGGPSALQRVVPLLPGNFPWPVVVVQHMPAGFTAALAKRLDEVSALEVREAIPGDLLRQGRVLIAPAGSQLVVERSREGLVARTTADTPWPTLFRPSVDSLLHSLAGLSDLRTLAVIMTGMGNDGLRGAQMIKEAGGRCIAEAESSCVVYGMPRAIVEAGLADLVVPLSRIADAILNFSF